MELTIIGGGDSGLLTALCIRASNPEPTIRVVDDFDQAQPDVGKATFQAITGILHDYLGIERKRFIREVKPVFKVSAYFEDWTGKRPFHHPFDVHELVPNPETPQYAERLRYLYERIYPDPDCRGIAEEIVHQGKTPFFMDGYQLDEYPHYAYQFETGSFNEFLRSLCEDRDITLVNDRVDGVDLDDNTIGRVHGHEASYTADLFVDASGFQRVLIDELDTKMRTFDIPLDAAVVANVERPISEVVPATVFHTGEYGWFWEIDTIAHRDLGYVFGTDYIDKPDAEAEFRAEFGLPSEAVDVETYRFSSGYYRNAWVGNCVAIGNAAGFVEPLQAPNLTTNAQAAVALSLLLAGHGGVIHDGIRRTYNRTATSLWESIYDFLYMHYRWNEGDNAFWEDMRNLAGSERTDQIIREYNRNGLVTAVTPVDSAVNPVSGENDIWSLVLFPLDSFYSVMRRMGATSEFYETDAVEVTETVMQQAHQNLSDMKAQVDRHLTHEEFYDMALERPPKSATVDR